MSNEEIGVRVETFVCGNKIMPGQNDYYRMQDALTDHAARKGKKLGPFRYEWREEPSVAIGWIFILRADYVE